MSWKLRLLPTIFVCAMTGAVAWAAFGPSFWPLVRSGEPHDDIAVPVAELNRRLQDQWAAVGIEPSGSADALQVLRRLSLTLVGTVPSLDEVRAFEADSATDRLERWTDR